MYLRRFAEKRRKNFFTVASDVTEPTKSWETNITNVAAPTGFYTFLTEDGGESREVEQFFTKIEDLATPALATILDNPRWALTDEWPLPPNTRERLAWFMAAQIVRTTRQRKRIDAQNGPSLDLPGHMRESDLASQHAKYIRERVGILAYILSIRPWGLAHSGACLIASDCPVVILNGHDDNDQSFAATVDEVVFPLDPHRLIFMPGVFLVDEDPRKGRDHRIKFDGIGQAFTQAVFDAADRYTFAHPSHIPDARLMHYNGRLPAPGQPDNGGGYALSYAPMHPDFTIEKRWASEHPPPRSMTKGRS
ncbi:DUF4238 domain-containing protein [Plantibacter sp. CFBP 8804]|nr:DUF4238 domain-containing protein [Plantibacter sp. CFBP 8804]